GLGRLGEDVGQLGIAQQRLGRDAAHVQADASPVLLLDDRRAQPELGGTDGSRVSSRTRAQDHDVVVSAHVSDHTARRSARLTGYTSTRYESVSSSATLPRMPQLTCGISMMVISTSSLSYGSRS